MKLILITGLVLGACTYQPPTCGLPNEPLSAPCPTVTPPSASKSSTVKPPVGIAQRPGVLPQPSAEKVKGNNGWGNGDQDVPGKSKPNNNAENRGGNHNGRDEATGRSWHETEDMFE